ncbi:16056_t:CDS:2, partial [Cetraspora pellucida]
PNARAKDMRAISAFLAQDSDADISMILTLDNWSRNSENTLQTTCDILYHSK